MDSQGDITDLKHIAELEKENEKLKLQQLNKSLEITNTSKNEEKQHPQDDSLSSTSKSTSIEAIVLPSTSTIEFHKTPNEILASTDNSGKTHSKEAQKGNDRNQFSVYKKRPGTYDQGKEYEYLMCAYYALKLCFNETVVDFEMTTNNEDYGDFDDVALTVTFRDNSSHIFLIQLKHKEKADKGITETIFSAQKGDFSLLKYCKSFHQNLQDRDNVICILFTNGKSKIKDKSKFELEDENIIVNQCQPPDYKQLLIDTVSDDQTAHIFYFKQNGQNLRSFENFFKSFYLFTNQKSSSNMQSHIDKLLYEKFGCKFDFIGFMRQWWKGRFVLNKHDIIVKLAELVLSPFIQEIPKNVNEPLSDKAKLLKNAIMQFETTFVKDYDANAVAKIWIEESADSKMMSKASHKYGLTTKGLEDLIAQDFAKVLWFLNKVPLIVKYDEKEEKRIRAALELLAMETDKMKLVLVGQNLEETFYKGKILESLYDLRNTPLYEKIVTKFGISLQERQSIRLEKFIHSNTETAKHIEIKDLFLMLEKHLNIGKPLPKLPVAYIPRILKHNNSLSCEDKAFVVFNNPVSLVIGKPGIGKSTLMTYLSHQCPADYWCVRVNLIEFGKFFSGRHSSEEIMNEFLKDEDPFFDKVKETFRKNKRIYLLLDGLDEIDANCVETVLTLIKDISSNGIRVWISSREHLKDRVSNYFNMSPITIEELEEENQKEYIEQRLCNKSEGDETVNYTEDEAKEIITRLFASVNATYNAKNILGVPLLLFIITDIFRNDKSNLEEMINEDIFVLTKMYKIFFEGKEKHLYEKAVVQNKGVLNDDLDYKLKRYELPALKASLSEFLPKLELDSKKINKSQVFLEKIRHKGDPLGIISQVVGDTNEFRAIFSHQSFAEYFACVWLIKNKEKLGLIKDWFFDSYSYSYNVRLIFDTMLAEDKPLHLAILYKNPDQIKKYINCCGENDKGGRNALHLISSYSDDDRMSKIYLCMFTPRDLTIYQLLLKKCNPFEEDELFKRNCLDYALCRNSLLLFEVILEAKCNAETIDINGIIEHFGGSDKVVESCCLYGYFHLLKTLIERNFAVNIINYKVPILIDLGKSRTITLLHLASPNGNRDIIELLWKKGCEINVTDNKNWTPLHYACNWGSYDAVIKILEFGGDLNAVTDKKQTTLHLASKTDNTDIIELLLEKGCKVNVADENNWTPLHYACYYGRYDAVIKILEHGGDLNAVTDEKQTTLHLASKDGDTDIIELLLNKGCKVNATDENNWSPLHCACDWENYDAVLKILELGGDFNVVTNKKQTPLHLASEHGSTDIIELLLKKGCKVNVADENNWTPLHNACCHRKCDDVINILELGGDVNAVTNKKQTPLHIAAKNGNTDVIDLFLKKGCKVNVTDENNWTPLHYACSYGQYDAVIKILELGGDLNAVTNKRQTSSHLASTNINSKIIELLFMKGCKVNVGDESNWTPLHYACSYEAYYVVKKILELGGDVNAITNTKHAPLHVALASKNNDIIELLLMKGCKVNMTDENNFTPLHYAIFYKRYDAVIKILELGGDLNAVTNRKQTTLHLASMTGNIDIRELFLKKGCKVNVADENNWTPLHYACRYGQYDAVIKILKLGGDINAVTNERQTALHLATLNNETWRTKDIVTYLLKNGMNINAADEKNWTPLRYACNARIEYAVIEVMLENDAYLDAECRNILSKHFYDILYCGKVRLIEILLQRLTNTEIIGAVSYFPSEFPIHLATRNGHLRPDLLLKMAQLIDRYRVKNNIDLLIEEGDVDHLIANFDKTEELSPSTSENRDQNPKDLTESIENMYRH